MFVKKIFLLTIFVDISEILNFIFLTRSAAALMSSLFLKENSLNLQTAMSAIQRTLDTAYITVQW